MYQECRLRSSPFQNIQVENGSTALSISEYAPELHVRS
jgi:hypothetical protein